MPTNAPATLPHHEPGRRYDFRAALLSALNDPPGGGKYGRPSGLEAEVSQEIARRVDRQPEGFFLPLDVPLARHRRGRERRDLTTSTGSGAVATNTDAADLIDVLRARSVLATLGARMPIFGPGKVNYPRRSAGSNVYWVGEGVAPTAGTSTYDAVTFTPRTVGGYQDISRPMLSSQPAAADIVIDDLATAIGSELDRVGLAGSGSGAEPTGITSDANVPVVPLGTNGAAPTWAWACLMESTVGNNLAYRGSMGFVTTPNGRSKLRQVERFSGSGTIWERGEVLDVPAEATTNLPSNLTKGTGTNLSAAVFGNFDDLVIPMWGFIDVLIDLYKFSVAGVVRVVALLDCDVQRRQPKSFAICKDMLTT